MKSRCEACFWLGAMVLALWTSGCLDRPQGTAGSGTARPAAAPLGTAATSASAVARQVPVTAIAPGLDRCLVGTWGSTQVAIDHKLVHLSGGANVQVTINPGGDLVVDFAPMSVVTGTAGGSGFDFRYIGKGTATLKTPRAGSVNMSDRNISGVRVNATVKGPNGSAVPLLTNTPAAKLIPQGAAAAAGSSTQGIDPYPVLSADGYGCSPTQLVLTSSTVLTRWTFNRISRNLR
jgi:hypothetical protein